MKTGPMSEADFLLLLYRLHYLGGEPCECEFQRAIDWLDAGESGDSRGDVEDLCRYYPDSRAEVLLNSNFAYCFRHEDHHVVVGWIVEVADPDQMVELVRMWAQYMRKREKP